MASTIRCVLFLCSHLFVYHILQYIQPHEHEKLSQVELLVIDEAAAIPLPVVKSLLGPYLVFLSSTVNGYKFHAYNCLMIFVRNSYFMQGTHFLYFHVKSWILCLVFFSFSRWGYFWSTLDPDLCDCLILFLSSKSYEGTGRSLSLKLIQQLEQQSQPSAQSVEGPKSGIICFTFVCIWYKAILVIFLWQGRDYFFNLFILLWYH